MMATMPNLDLPTAPARLVIMGDHHGDLNHVLRVVSAAAEVEADVIVSVGDAGILWPSKDPIEHDAPLSQAVVESGIPLLIVPGNHDNWDAIDEAFENIDGPFAETGLDGIWWAGRGGRWEWSGRRLGAIPGATSVDQAWRTAGRSWWPQERPLPADVDRLGDEPLDILFSHDVPVEATPRPPWRVEPRFEAMSFQDRRLIQEAVERTRPALHLAGHWHMRITQTLSTGTVLHVLDMQSEPGNAVVLDLDDMLVLDMTDLVPSFPWNTGWHV